MSKIRVFICIALMAAIMTVPALAADTTSSVKVDISRHESGGVMYSLVNLSVDFGADHASRPVSLMVYPAGNMPAGFEGLSYLEQTVADANGTARFTWDTPEGGIYTVSIRAGGCEHAETADVTLVSPEQYEQILQKFRTATTEDAVIDAIDTHAGDIGLYTGFYDQMEDKSAVAQNVLAKKSTLTTGNLGNVLSECIIFAYLNTQDDSAKRIELIDYYNDSHFKLAAQADAQQLYASFKQMDTSLQDKVFDQVAGDADDFDQFRADFDEAVVLTAVQNMERSALDAFIIANNDYIAFDGYDALNAAQKSTVLSSLADDSSVSSMTELRSAYQTLKNGDGENEDNTNITIITGGSRGNGGGGGGSSFSSSNAYASAAVAPLSKEESGLYSDMSDDHWAYSAVKALTEAGIVSGTGNGSFEPEREITRAEYVKLLVSAFDISGEDHRVSYSDVTESDWYYPYVMAASDAGICNGHVDGSFGADDALTREDMATILYRLVLKQHLISFTEATTPQFSDAADISEYARNAVATLDAAGIVNGMDDGSFMPKTAAKRSEAAQLIYAVMNR